MNNRVLVALLSAALPLLSAQAGNSGRGGGGPTEAAFKMASIQLSESLVGLPMAFAKELKFDPRELLAGAYGAQPKCAEGDDLVLLKRQHKMAYVKGDNTNVILLNCENSVTTISPEWLEIFKLSTDSKIFIAHEILRTLNKESENSYLLSGSIASADLAFDMFRRERIITAYDPTTYKNTCKMKITAERCFNDYCLRVELYPKKTVDWAAPFWWSMAFLNAKNSLSSPIDLLDDILSLSPRSKLGQDSLRAMHVLRCFQD
jgi:hypothetical protein